MIRSTIEKSIHIHRILIIISFFITNYTSYAQSFPIKIERNKTLLPVEIGGCGPLKILLDSGMGFDGLLLYNPDLKDSINFGQVIEVKVPGAGSGEPSTALMDTLASFSIGKMRFSDQKVILLQSDAYKGFPSDGVIGYSILGHYVTEIDYNKKKIILYDSANFTPDRSWQAIPLYFKNNPIPWIDVSIVVDKEKPITISTYIDLASGDAIELLEGEDMKFSLPKITEKDYLGRGLSGDVFGKKGKISKLIIGGYELKEVATSITPKKIRSKQKNADGILGNDSLRRFNLIFDYANRILWIKPNDYFYDKFE